MKSESKKSSSQMGGILQFPVSEIQGVFLFEKKNVDERFTCYSPPHHLLHLVIEGEAEQQCNNREYHLKAGDMLWYHEGEFIEGRCLQAPWRYYSVVFHAPSLVPPSFGERLAHPDFRQSRRWFTELFDAWSDQDANTAQRSITCHAALAQILLLHNLSTQPSPAPSSPHWLSQLWWNIENHVRQNLLRTYTLQDLAKIGGTSPATVHRACVASVGISPMRRIKNLRMEIGQGLLLYSTMSVTDISRQIGYERVNEFSRDIKKAFSQSPSVLRRQIREKLP